MVSSFLRTSAFTVHILSYRSGIRVPRLRRANKLVTKQNVAYANLGPDSKGKVQGSLQITNPEYFWTNSKFLILVEN